MSFSKTLETAFSDILNTELMTAMGCTEPIAIAYCASRVRSLLNKEPERYVIHCSGNIIKNVKAVVVPQTGGLKGIEAAAVAGVTANAPERLLEVISGLTDEDRKSIRTVLRSVPITVRPLDSGHALHIIVELFAGQDHVLAEVIDTHTGIGRLEKNGELLHEAAKAEVVRIKEGYQRLNVRDILDYADACDLNGVRTVLQRQIECNRAVSEEGLRHVYGAGIGPALMKQAGNSLRERCKAAAAAGSDARMNGCAYPVVINSGSGNQGITVSVPILLRAEELGCSQEKLLRALCVGNLIAIRQKVGIGKLSAFCGATCAAIGAVCGIAYLDGADYDRISNTIINSLATIGGMVCDGAKSSCAGKIAAALDCAFTAYETAKQGRRYLDGEGLVKADVERTIDNVARMASVGMHGTDLEILDIMLEK